MKNTGFKRTKYTCYYTYLAMSSIFVLPPILFMTFREMYGISYTLLGTLVLTNFVTQLAVDLIFTLFAKHFNIKKVIRVMPLITACGLAAYALIPLLLPRYAYAGLVVGTVIFSVSAGLSEVLLSPVIAAIPSNNPSRDMSLLHSLYAFGFFTVVVVSTVFLRLFGAERWWVLTLLWSTLPVVASVLFFLSPIPQMEQSNEQKGTAPRTGLAMVLFVACIFFGSCAENAMGNWLSTYIESALHIDKALGDILGMAMFAILLGLTRILYAKYARNIWHILFLGMVGAAVCYLTAGLVGGTTLPFLACSFTGVFTSMLWPGSLILMEEKLPHVGVAGYALMAAGGDLGASLAPQLQGIVVDQVASFAPEQQAMKAGMLVSAIFPLLGVLVLLCIRRQSKKAER